MSSVPLAEIAYRVLRLEQQLESYQRLHAEELEEIRRILGEIKTQLVGMGADTTLEKSDKDGQAPGTR